jgi:hypothetical protein
MTKRDRMGHELVLPDHMPADIAVVDEQSGGLS